MNRLRSILSIAIITFAVPALATEEKSNLEEIVVTQKKTPASTLAFGLTAPVSASDVFIRTQYILEQYFKFKPEPSYQTELNAFANQQSLTGYNKLAKFMDETNQFPRFSMFQNANDGVVHAFQDRDHRSVADFSLSLAKLIPRKTAFGNFNPTSSKPLAGLKIAIDPGHMGSTIWDERTGKFIKDGQGHTLSEGLINLQTSLLLKARFESEGATVLVTHEKLEPVTTQTWDGLNLQDFIPDEMRNASLRNWFISLVDKEPPGKKLEDEFVTDSNVKRIFSEEMRHDFYVLRADIDARAKMIEAFQPEITLVIHYDVNVPPHDEHGVSLVHADFTKIFIPGNFMPAEFASRAYRRDFAKHIFEPYWWNASLVLSRQIISTMTSTLKIPAQEGFANSVTVEKGILARNLSLTRQLADTAIAYVECLYYNDPTEFQQFIKPDHTMVIGGASYPYSKRLVQVVDGLEKGVLKFANLVYSNRSGARPNPLIP